MLAVQKTWVQSLGWEDPLEKGMATHSSILAWRIPWTEEPGRLQSIGSQRAGHDRKRLSTIIKKKIKKKKKEDNTYLEPLVAQTVKSLPVVRETRV